MFASHLTIVGIALDLSNDETPVILVVLIPDTPGNVRNELVSVAVNEEFYEYNYIITIMIICVKGNATLKLIVLQSKELYKP